jgi:Putative phage tail protein
MRPLTADQATALTRSFTPGVSVVLTHANNQQFTLPVIGGTVDTDASSFERTTVDLVLPLDAAPTAWGDPVVPDDAVLDVTYSLGVGPAVRVARVWLDEARVVRPEGEVRVRAYSRATRVSQGGFPTGDRRYSGTTVAVVQAIVADALGAGHNDVTTVVLDGLVGPTVTKAQAFTGDPWQAVEDLMDAAGGEAYFDELDRLVLRKVPTAEPPAVTRLKVGEGGTITGYEVSLVRAPNAVRMAFQNPSGAADVVGTATATGNAAPTGPYGWYRTDEVRYGVVSQAQANTAAAEWLKRAGGLMRTVTFTASPHPGIQVGDVIEVEYVNAVVETHRVVAVSLPLTPGEAMTVTTRSKPW